MIQICGRPFLEYQLALLRSHGVNDFILCIGHLGDLLESHFGDGSRFGVSIRYGRENRNLLGTAGALKNVEQLLDEDFFVTYGDAYLVLDYQHAAAYFRQHDRLGLMVVYKNRGRYDRSNVVVQGRFVSAYDKERTLPGMEYIDFGVSILRKEALRRIPPGLAVPLEKLYAGLVAEQQLLAYRARRRFYEIGSPRGLSEFGALVRAGRIRTIPLDHVLVQ
jgi:NDP-sugar pyrophosphorylase family protein